MSTTQARRRLVLNEWGIAFLALVMAVLLWIVMRRSIETSYHIAADVRAVVTHPELFAAFPQGKVTLQLQGPRGELDNAIRRLDERALGGEGGRWIDAVVRDLAPGEVRRTTPVTS